MRLLDYYDKEIAEYALDDIDFNGICRVTIIYDFYILLINSSWIIVSWDDPYVLLISSALKSHFSTQNWQYENEYKN